MRPYHHMQMFKRLLVACLLLSFAVILYAQSSEILRGDGDSSVLRTSKKARACGLTDSTSAI